MTPGEEKAYIQGENVYARRMLSFVTGLLRENGEEADGAVALKTLGEVKVALRALCEDLEIEFPEGLHLVDVIEKYISPAIIVEGDEGDEGGTAGEVADYYMGEETAEAFAVLLGGTAFRGQGESWVVVYDDGKYCGTYQECLAELADEFDMELVPYGQNSEPEVKPINPQEHGSTEAVVHGSAEEGFRLYFRDTEVVARIGQLEAEKLALKEQRDDLRECFDSTRHEILEALGETDMGHGWFWTKSAVSELRAELAARRASDGCIRDLLNPASTAEDLNEASELLLAAPWLKKAGES